MKYNNRERALSTDLNREQAFISAEMAEFARSLFLNKFDNAASPYYSTNENDSTPVVTDRPVRGIVFKGLRPYPINGTVDLLITAGMLAMIDDVGGIGADDSAISLIRDEGVPSTGVLTLTPNSSGTGRVDIVECKVITYDYETSSRDIYDPGTGLFSPATVTKVTGKKLQYRIRTGSPSSAWPGIVDEWLPLCVLVVPDGTTTFDTVELYDVRPHAMARKNMTEVDMKNPSINELKIDFDYLNQHVIRPILDIDFRTFKIIWGDTGAPSSSPLKINVQDTSIYDPAWVPGTSEFANLFLAFPFGLPRWAKYSDTTTSPRKPQREGIPILTNKNVSFYNTGATATALPTASGLVGTVATNEMVAIANCWVDSGGTVRGSIGNKNKMFVSAASASKPEVLYTTFTDSLARFNTRLIVPTNCKRAKLRIVMSYNYTPGAEDLLLLGNQLTDAKALYPTTTTPVQTNLGFQNEYTYYKSGGGYGFAWWFFVELPGWYDLEVVTNFNTASAVTPFTAVARLVEWSV